MATKNALFNYEQKFYINGILLSGVTDIDGSYSVSQEPINIIGKGYTYPVKQGSMIGNFNIKKYYIGDDPLLKYIDETPIKASINYGDKSIGFDQGFLTEYSFSAGIGQIPQAQASINVYGNLGAGISAEGSNPQPDVEIPNQGSILLNSKDYETNRVSRFDYTIRINRNPLYKIGSTEPVQVDIQYPLFQEVNLQMDLNDYELTKFKDFIKKPYQQDINIILNNPIDNSRIDTFTIKNARIVSHSFNSTSTDNTTLTVAYNGYINKEEKQYTQPIIYDIINIEDGSLTYVNEDFTADNDIQKSIVNNAVGGFIINSTMTFLSQEEEEEEGFDVLVNEPSIISFRSADTNRILATGITLYTDDSFIKFKLPRHLADRVIAFDAFEILENELEQQDGMTASEAETYQSALSIISQPGIHKMELLV